jgi:hypothetical protein
MYFNQVRLVVTRYVKGNWGFRFVALFMLFLFLASVLSTNSAWSLWAEQTADVAFFALVIGVVFQLGDVNSKTTLKSIARIKKLKIELRHFHLGKNKLKNGAAF